MEYKDEINFQNIENPIKIEENDENNKIKMQNLKNIISNNEKFTLKKNIIIKISNQLINNRINLIQDNSDDNLDLLQIIDILNKLDNSFSSFSFNEINSNDININNENTPVNNPEEFYYQLEFKIIQNIFSKISKYYNINFNESIEVVNKNFIKISNKQINSKSKNKYNSNYYYIYNILYDYIILFLILNKNDINNKEIKYYSPVDRLFLCESKKEQKLICNILNTYLDFNTYINKENIFQELKSTYYVISLFTNLNILKRKLKSNNNNINNDNIKDDENNNNNYFYELNNEIKNEENKVYNNLNYQDFCKIILKKDFIINQLEAKLENINRNTNTNNENTFRDLEEENEIIKKEIEDLKKKYDLEFELMASAVYGLGINLFFSKEQQLNNRIINSSSWITRQKDYIMELNE